jgi:hypothetical protein
MAAGPGMQPCAASICLWHRQSAFPHGRSPLGSHPVLPIPRWPSCWMHPFDDQGRRRGYEDIPKSIKDLIDDPFRSLAGQLRRVGGFAKDTASFSEFLWADFLRRRMKRKTVERDFDGALEQALRLAKSEDADYLPGWCGAIAR